MLCQSSQKWKEQATGEHLKDYKLLQRISCEEPEIFWPQLLQHLRINFAKDPIRSNSSTLPAIIGQGAASAVCLAEGGDKERLKKLSCDFETEIGKGELPCCRY